MAPPVKSLLSEPTGTWEAFQRLRPVGILNDAGEVLERIDGTAFLTLIGEGARSNHPDRPAIQIGVLRLLRDFVDRLPQVAQFKKETAQLGVAAGQNSGAVRCMYPYWRWVGGYIGFRASLSQ